MFLAADEDNFYRKPEGGMSIEEKMHLWESNQSNYSSEPPDVSDCFQGVEEVHECANHTDLPLYSRAILQSGAYEWFIGTLLKESSFHWDPSVPRIMVDVVRPEIINALPKGRISKARDPCVHEAQFRVPWRPIAQRLDLEANAQATTFGKALPTAVVLVGSADDYAQAITVEEYVVQTWGSGGKRLLSTLAAAFDLDERTDPLQHFGKIRA